LLGGYRVSADTASRLPLSSGLELTASRFRLSRGVELSGCTGRFPQARLLGGHRVSAETASRFRLSSSAELSGCTARFSQARRLVLPSLPRPAICQEHVLPALRSSQARSSGRQPVSEITQQLGHRTVAGRTTGVVTVRRRVVRRRRSVAVQYQGRLVAVVRKVSREATVAERRPRYQNDDAE